MDINTKENRFNSGNAFGQGMIEHSVSALGYGRSIVTDKDGVVLCGHFVAELANRNNSKIHVVETDGDELVVVVRRDLSFSDRKAKELSLIDNLSSKMNIEWDADKVQQAIDADISLDLHRWNAEECAVKELDIRELFVDGYVPKQVKAKSAKEYSQPAQASLFDDMD